MIDNFIRDYPWLLLIVVIGSLVDIFQFSWMFVGAINRYKDKMRESVRKEIIAEIHDAKKMEKAS